MLASHSLNDLFERIKTSARQSNLTPEQRELGDRILSKLKTYHIQTQSKLEKTHWGTRFLAWIRGECYVATVDHWLVEDDRKAFAIQKFTSRLLPSEETSIYYATGCGKTYTEEEYLEYQRYVDAQPTT